jgi:hypothetical protein
MDALPLELLCVEERHEVVAERIDRLTD